MFRIWNLDFEIFLDFGAMLGLNSRGRTCGITRGASIRSPKLGSRMPTTMKPGKNTAIVSFENVLYAEAPSSQCWRSKQHY